MSAALYVRVSTDAQAEKGYSIEAQLDKLRAYCALNGIADFKEYVDAGYSASNLNRPALSRLVQDIQSGAVGAVAVYKLDRLSRKTKDTLYLVEDVFNKNDVQFVSLSENIDTSSASGKFFLSILSSVAQLERENIRERSMLGRKKKAETGIKERTSKILIGYDYDEKTERYTVNDYEAMQIRELFSLYLSGMGLLKIYNLFKSKYNTKYGAWKTVRKLQYALDDESYTGKFKHGGDFYEGENIPAIIDEDTFRRVREIREYKKTHYYRHTSGYLLTGLLRCGECGSRMRGYPHKYKDKRTDYYVCYNRDSSHLHMRTQENCRQPYYRCGEIDGEIHAALALLAGGRKYYDSQKRTEKEDYGARKETLEREIKKLSDKASRAVDMLIETGIDKETFLKRISEINAQKEALEAQLSEIKRAESRKKPVEYAETKELATIYSEAELPEKRAILARLIEKIVVFKDRSIKIHWNF
ncbi:MAG: recombinase family protein [Clostridiales bacterium]|nr:recombinase family protein [Clostridiales bacterium]